MTHCMISQWHLIKMKDFVETLTTNAAAHTRLAEKTKKTTYSPISLPPQTMDFDARTQTFVEWFKALPGATFSDGIEVVDLRSRGAGRGIGTPGPPYTHQMKVC